MVVTANSNNIKYDHTKIYYKKLQNNKEQRETNKHTVNIQKIRTQSAENSLALKLYTNSAHNTTVRNSIESIRHISNPLLIKASGREKTQYYNDLVYVFAM